MSEVVDSTADEVGTDIERVPEHPPANLFGTDDPVEVIQKATTVADALRDVIVNKKLFKTIHGKDHVLVDGWQLVGAMLGVTAVCVATEAVDGGYKATVESRTADGRVIGRADALCTKYEKSGPWKGADDYARLSMAQTRATAKALKGPLGFVVSLAGYSATPAEEMTHVEPQTAPQEPAVEVWRSAGISIEQYLSIEEHVVRLGSPIPRVHALLDALKVQPEGDLGKRMMLLDAATALKVQKKLAEAVRTEVPSSMPDAPEIS